MGYCPLCKEATPMEYELHRCLVTVEELGIIIDSVWSDWELEPNKPCWFSIIAAAILEKYEVRRKR